MFPCKPIRDAIPKSEWQGCSLIDRKECTPGERLQPYEVGLTVCNGTCRVDDDSKYATEVGNYIIRRDRGEEPGIKLYAKLFSNSSNLLVVLDIAKCLTVVVFQHIYLL